MSDQNATKQGLIEELRRTRERIAQLQMREIEITQTLGDQHEEAPKRLIGFVYAEEGKGMAWVPGVLLLEGQRQLIKMPAASTVEPQPDFSWLDEIFHPEDISALNYDFQAFAHGGANIVRRCRLHLEGLLTVWGNLYCMATDRDGNGKPIAAVISFEAIGLPTGVGPYLRQAGIELIELMDSAQAEDSPLANLLGKQVEQGLDWFSRTSRESWLGRGLVMAELRRHTEHTDLYFIKDPSMKYAWVSDPYAKLLGLRREDFQGRSDKEIFGLVDESEEARMSEAVLRGMAADFPCMRFVAGMRQAFRDSLWAIPDRGSGEAQWILGFSSPVKEAKGETDQKFGSPVMHEVFRKARKAAKFNSIVLLTGESGSGKDYLARDIHNRSERADEPYFSINCAAIPAEMAESELFGHERGAFTGSLTRKRGLLELAEGGTLLLNEIGEMRPDIQAKLLTFLDTGSFNRVGGERLITPNVRIIVATHRNLAEEVTQGRFLEPLFHRLQVFDLELPPLRKRLEDLPIIVDELLTKLCEKLALSQKPKVTSSHMSALASYHWPGNVRELRNVLERSLILSAGTGLALGEALPKKRHEAEGLGRGQSSDTFAEHEWCLSGEFRQHESQGSLLELAERSLIEQALENGKGIKKEAARLLGITWPSFKRKFENLMCIRDCLFLI